MKRVARLLNGLCAVACVAVVAVTAAFLLIDPNDYKLRLIDAVQDATGRTLTLGGPLTLTRSLWPTLEVSDVSLSNLAGGSRPQMVHVERIEGQLALLSLLRHEVDITRLALTGPNILFETVGGAPNWVFSAGAQPGQSEPASGTAPFPLRVEAASVLNGMVTWKLPARTKVVGIRSLAFERKREGGPISARSILVYADNQPFGLDITAKPTGGLMDPWQTRLQFDAYDISATATGRLAIAGAYDMQVEATAGMLEKLNALLPEMGLPALRQTTLSAHLANGARPGDLPIIGPASLRFASADLRDRLPGLTLAATRATLAAAGGQAAIDGTGRYAGTGFHLTGSVGVPLRLDGKASVPVNLSVEAADGVLTREGECSGRYAAGERVGYGGDAAGARAGRVAAGVRGRVAGAGRCRFRRAGRVFGRAGAAARGDAADGAGRSDGRGERGPGACGGQWKMAVAVGRFECGAGSVRGRTRRRWGAAEHGADDPGYGVAMGCVARADVGSRG